MSRLGSFFRGLPPLDAPWSLARRPADAPPTAPWAALVTAGAEGDVAAELAAPSPAVRPLDVLRVAEGPRTAHWFVREDGVPVPLSDLGGVPQTDESGALAVYGDDWGRAWWEAPDGARLLVLCRWAGVALPVVGGLGCRFAREVLDLVPADESEFARALDLAEAWLGRGARELAREATPADAGAWLAWEAAGRTAHATARVRQGPDSARRARRAVAAAAHSVMGEGVDPAGAALEAAVARASAAAEGAFVPRSGSGHRQAAYDHAIAAAGRAQAAAVRAAVPLAAVLLGVAQRVADAGWTPGAAPR